MHHLKMHIYVKLVSNSLRNSTLRHSPVSCQGVIANSGEERYIPFIPPMHAPHPLCEVKPPTPRALPCNSATVLVHISAQPQCLPWLLFLSDWDPQKKCCLHSMFSWVWRGKHSSQVRCILFSHLSVHKFVAIL